MPEQREAQRVRQLALSCDVLVPLAAVVTELSTTGMQIETARPLHLESVHEFRLTLASSAVVLRGRVVHSHIEDVNGDLVTYVSGVQFVEISPAGAAGIAEYLAQLSNARRSAQS
jgi:hypothetical protein